MPAAPKSTSAPTSIRAKRERGARTEDGGRRTEDGERRTEDGGLRTEGGGRMEGARGSGWRVARLGFTVIARRRAETVQKRAVDSQSHDDFPPALHHVADVDDVVVPRRVSPAGSIKRLTI